MEKPTWRHENQQKSLFGVVLGAPGRDLGAQWAPWPSQVHFRVAILRSWTPPSILSPNFVVFGVYFCCVFEETSGAGFYWFGRHVGDMGVTPAN